MQFGTSNWPTSAASQSYVAPPGYRLVPDERTLTRQQQLEMQARAQYPTRQEPAPPPPMESGPKYQVPARFIEPDEVTLPNEVLPDSTPSVFIQNDYQAVYLKAVNTRGIIDSVKYVPERPVNPEKPEESNAPLSVDLTGLEELIVAPLMAEINELKKTIAQNRPQQKYYKPNNKGKTVQQAEGVAKAASDAAK